MIESARDRVAEVIYGDGNELAWARAVEIADLVIWELGLRRDYCLRCGLPHPDQCKRDPAT